MVTDDNQLTSTELKQSAKYHDKISKKKVLE